MASSTQTWRSYEELARHVLQHFADILGISEVEAKQRLAGASGTRWEVDAKGVMADGNGFLIVECKQRSGARLNQGTVGQLAFAVKDVGAQGAIIVTSTDLQEGARKIAQHEGFKMVYLPKAGTFEEFFASCGNCLLQKITDRMSVSVTFAGGVYTKAETK
jgi:hypothetical protein